METEISTAGVQTLNKPALAYHLNINHADHFRCYEIFESSSKLPSN